MKISAIMTTGLLLLLLSSIVDGLILVVPFLPFTIAKKAIIISGMFFCGNVFWWIGVPLVGKEIVARYKKYLDPRSWPLFRKKTGTHISLDSDVISSGKDATATNIGKETIPIADAKQDSSSN